MATGPDISRRELLTTLSEIVGFKTGLVVSEWDIIEHLDGHDDLLIGLDDDVLSVSASMFEGLSTALMAKLGSIPGDARELPGVVLTRKYGDVPEQLALIRRLDELFARFIAEDIGRASADNPLAEFAEIARRHCGAGSDALVGEYCGRVVTFIHASPWSSFRRHEYVDWVVLDNLFASESLAASHGQYVDQRFVNYLASNPEALDRMNWRKFEGLVGEFFHRCGYHVDLGRGRNDGGIDARVWPGNEAKSGPPAMLVQCKRERRSIGKVVVKALWADVVHEQAQSGLIVTTSKLSPGAKLDCVARAYPIASAERPTLHQWLRAMRTPLSGMFLGG